MFARMAMNTVRSEKLDEGKRVWESEIIPAMKSQKGFKNVYVLGNDKEKKIVTISFWETEADADAWEKHPKFGAFKDKAMSMVAGGQGRIDGYDVKLHA